MKYKLKFEIDYSGMNKGEIRDSKLSEILTGDKEMLEIDIDPSVSIPIINEVVVLGNSDYKVIYNKYKIEADCYTTILLVKLVSEVKLKKFMKK